MEWVDDLPASRRPGTYIKYAEEAAQLRANPGRWAVLATASTRNIASSRSWLINQGRLKAFATVGDWESVARGCEIYVRYVGGGTG